jgi:hypothetical protein
MMPQHTFGFCVDGSDSSNESDSSVIDAGKDPEMAGPDSDEDSSSSDIEEDDGYIPLHDHAKTGKSKGQLPENG